MTGKTQECYYQALHVFKCDTDHECDPYSVGVDYEIAFFKMVNVRFPDAFLVGCYFHFMQALLKKLKELHVPKEQIAIAIRPDMLGLLPYLPKDELFAKESHLCVPKLPIKLVVALKRWMYFLNTLIGEVVFIPSIPHISLPC